MDGVKVDESMLLSRWRERLTLDEQTVRPWVGHVVVGWMQNAEWRTGDGPPG